MTTEIDVATEQQLNQAIATVETSPADDYVIVFTADITEGTDTGQSITFGATTLAAPPELYAINLQSGNSETPLTLTIDGNGHTLDGAGTYRGLFVYSGQVTIRNLTIQNAVATGGAGAAGVAGGGGG